MESKIVKSKIKKVLLRRPFDFIRHYNEKSIVKTCHKMGISCSQHYYNLVRYFKTIGIMTKDRKFTDKGKRLQELMISIDKNLDHK